MSHQGTMKRLIVLILCFGVVLITALPENRVKRNEETEPWKAIHKAARTADIRSIELAIRNGTDINIKDQSGRSTLYIAARFGKHLIVDFLIKNGANINLKDNNQEAPIYTATFEGHERVVDVLIKSGADVNIKEKNGWSPLMVASKRNYDNIVELLLENGADINGQNKAGATSLYVAADFGRDKIAQILIQRGADINIETQKKQTPLYSASYEGFLAIVEMLIRRGANINVQENDGRTPLHAATEKGNKDIVDILLRNGADKDIKTNKGAKPVDIANAKGYSEILELIQTVKRIKPSELACRTYSELPLNRIIGGELAQLREFPWMAALGYIDVNNNYSISFDCGGTIISEFYILTAAHCAKSIRLPIVVRYGKLSLTDIDNTKSINRQIKEITRHPGYSIRTKKNDIALIRVSRSISFTSEVIPACLQIDVADLSPEIKLIVTGFGATSADRIDKSTELLKTELVTMPTSQCNGTLLEINQRINQPSLREGISEGQYCAHDPNASHDSCQGDSGGPLLYFPPNATLANVVGIVSFGLTCGTELPSLYTRVAFYADWIESIVWPIETNFDIKQSI